MSQPSIEQALNIKIMGKRACELDVNTLHSLNDLAAWEISFWERFNETFSAPEFNNIQKLKDVFDSDFVARFDARRAEFQAAEKKAQTPDRIIVKGKRYSVIQEFEVIRPNWEMDGTGWVVKTKEGKKIVLTSHGSKYFADPDELEGLMKYYRRITEGMNAALELVTPSQ